MLKRGMEIVHINKQVQPEIMCFINNASTANFLVERIRIALLLRG